jgi:signal transduction histidine kinase
LFHPDGRPVIVSDRPLPRILRGEEYTDWQLRVRQHDNGQERFFSFSGMPIRDQSEKISLAVLIVRDITDSKRAEIEIRRARDQLTRSNQELEQRVSERTATLIETINELERFSYSLSHDMRAPLRAIGNYARILRADFSDRLGDEAGEMLNRIVAAASRLDQLILDVLSLSRLNNGQMDITHSVDLEKLLNQIIHERQALQPPRAQIKIQKPLFKICGHEALITQCLSNLLDNAVKFVSPGVHPEVRIWTDLQTSRVQGQENASDKRPDHVPDNGGSPKEFVRLWIQDNGIGIPIEHHQRIFAMFERLHSVEFYQGTGIGLAIVRKAVERMGGSVGLKSEPGKGSTFWLELPAAEACS